MTKSADIAPLVSTHPLPNQGRWLAALVVALAVVCAAYLVLCWRPGDLSAGAAITTTETWRMRATGYVLGNHHDVVIAGSSLADVMREGYFSADVRNLSLPGGSAITGLEIIACHRPLPRILLVEANILSRQRGDAFIAPYCFGPSPVARARVLLQHFHPLRAALARALFGDPASSFARQAWAGEAARLRAEAPRSYDIDEKIRVARDTYNRAGFETLARANAQRIAELTATLEQQGVKVYFLHMPVPPAIRDTRYVAGTEALLREALGGRGRWLDLGVADADLRWVDHGHLDPRSAVLIADAIVRALPDAR